QDAEDQIGRGGEAGRGAVMFVDEDVEAELVGELPAVEIFVIEVGRLLRVDQPVGQRDADRIDVLEPSVGIGLFGKVIDAHRSFSFDPEIVRDQARAAKAPTWRAKAAGCSTWGKRPAFSISSKRAPGMRSA